MAPLPKKKHAKSRTRTRKAAISLKLPQLVICPNCKNLKIPHHACPNCGYYQLKTKAHAKESSPKADIPKV